MAVTTDQQSQVDMQAAIDAARVAAGESTLAKANKLEALRMAKEILMENRRTQSASEATDITSSAVTTLAGELNTFVNS